MGRKDFQTLLHFFKALANENRLKIVGILANRECSVQELAGLLDLKASTVTHHLGKLKALRLVDMRTDGNDHLHRLNLDAILTMSKDIFTSRRMASLVDDMACDAWERKVLKNFLEGDRIRAIPAGYKKRLAVLKWLLNDFEEGVKYREKEVNEIITHHHPDYCTLRRELISNGLMQRKNGVYWRTKWQLPKLAR